MVQTHRDQKDKDSKVHHHCELLVYNNLRYTYKRIVYRVAPSKAWEHSSNVVYYGQTLIFVISECANTSYVDVLLTISTFMLYRLYQVCVSLM